MINIFSSKNCTFQLDTVNLTSTTNNMGNAFIIVRQKSEGWWKDTKQVKCECCEESAGVLIAGTEE